ncbi:hypothetical protein [Streptomyces sp. GQFP]|uniref:hypothetical protein n=1 Tax=Streptomyces sp. GQFP TaxID=2907545 RepID=UPI001F2B2FD8|nr:hypothetical protein [Streptomyces sp. GQFP]UIX31253.1 hypothetical protein LUX31_15060 [Streptomyces sp. GQFP]
MTTPANTDRCGRVRASLFYGAPILSETGACVLSTGHKGDHEDRRGGTWGVIPLYPMTNTGKGADER